MERLLSSPYGLFTALGAAAGRLVELPGRRLLPAATRVLCGAEPQRRGEGVWGETGGRLMGT